MLKLATPVQYEPSLEGLNILRPLQLTEESKTVISYPVLCKNPPSKDKPAIGKLARCSQQGAMPKSMPVWANKTGGDTLEFELPVRTHHITFPVKVLGVNALYLEWVMTSHCYWCFPDFTTPIIEIGQINHMFLPFIGTDIYFYADLAPFSYSWLNYTYFY